MHSSRSPGPTAISRLLASQEEPLRNLLGKAAELAELKQHVCTLIGAPDCLHVTATTLFQDTLTVTIDSPAWAARLRFRAPEILAAARTHRALSSVRNVRIRVGGYPGKPPLGPPAQPAAVSRESSEFLEQLAESTADLTLRSILRRLARLRRGNARDRTGTGVGSEPVGGVRPPGADGRK